jgi:hypothetical protein
MVGTNDFASYKSVQKYLYRTAQDLKKGKIGAAQASAAAKIASTWIAAHKLAQEAYIIQRIDGLEELIKKRSSVLGSVADEALGDKGS